MEVGRCLYTNFFLDHKKPKGWNPFYMKLLGILEEHAYELPELNQVKWPGWPSKNLTKSNSTQLKTIFPNFETGPLEEKTTKKMLKRFDTLASLMGFEDKRIEFMNELTVDQEAYAKIKVLISCHISGKKLLKNRIALKSWKRFYKHFQQQLTPSIDANSETDVTDFHPAQPVPDDNSEEINIEGIGNIVEIGNIEEIGNTDSSSDIDSGTSLPSLINSAQQFLYSILPTTPTKKTNDDETKITKRKRRSLWSDVS